MIKVSFIRKNDEVVGVHILDHASPIVCSAVSVLVLNCANSIEEFTDAGFKVEGDLVDGGDVSLEVTEPDDEGKAWLLLNSLILGLITTADSYKGEITIDN